MPPIPRLLQRGRALLFALLAALFACSTFAQDAPPGRIGRIAWISGDVFLNNPETGELGAAPLNQPLTSGDVVATGPGARAEIQIGSMTLRLDSGTRVEFDRIDDDQVRVLLNGGHIIAKLPTDDTRRDFQLETGHGRFLPRDTGIYRFDYDNGNTGGTAYFGSVRFESRDTALDINAGESARIWTNNAGQLDYRMAQGVRDEFTQWSATRDPRQRSSVAANYVSPEMTGVQDLDAYGDWSETPDYGTVWIPRAVASDWAPYRTGHWTWVAPWGWTWVGHEPWGFAPFHYGRWARVHGAWAWVPGARIARPVYAPALVAWVGTPGGSVSISVGSSTPAGWFPLAPREVYVPFYRSSAHHVRFVNAPHVQHIRDIDRIVAHPHEVVRQTHFIHRDEPRAFTSAPPDVFRHRGPETRVTPRPADVRTEHHNQPVIDRPLTRIPDTRRAPDTDRRHDSQPPQRIEPGERKTPPIQHLETSAHSDRQEPQILRQAVPLDDPARPRRQEPSIRQEPATRERHEVPVRHPQQPVIHNEPTKPAVQQIQQVQRNEPQISRESREVVRPAEPRREPLTGNRNERPQPAIQQQAPQRVVRQENREERHESKREEKRDDRREHTSGKQRPGETERR